MSVPYECYFCLNLWPFFTEDRLGYYTDEAILFGTLSLSSHPFYLFLLSFVKPL